MAGICGWWSNSAQKDPERLTKMMVETLLLGYPMTCLSDFGNNWGTSVAGESKKRTVFHDEGGHLIAYGNIEVHDHGLKQAAAADGLPKALLDSYRRHGRDFIKSLDGNFALVIMLTRQNRLFAATDSLGLTRLYYSCTAKGSVFSTSLETFYNHPLVGNAINRLLPWTPVLNVFMAPFSPNR